MHNSVALSFVARTVDFFDKGSVWATTSAGTGSSKQVSERKNCAHVGPASVRFLVSHEYPRLDSTTFCRKPKSAFGTEFSVLLRITARENVPVYDTPKWRLGERALKSALQMRTFPSPIGPSVEQSCRKPQMRQRSLVFRAKTLVYKESLGVIMLACVGCV